MKPKTLIIFVAILAVLLGVVAYQKMTEEPPAPIATQIGLRPLVPETLTRDAVTRIELYAGEEPDEPVVLEKDGDAWRIASLFNAPVNAATLDDFLDKLLNLQGEPRATAATEERLAEFALTDAEAFHVVAYAADDATPDLHLLFGKSADFRTVFLRQADAEQVYVEAVNLRREAGASDSGPGAIPKPTKWLKTTLLEVDKDAITQVALRYPDKELLFERREVLPPEPEPQETDEGEEDDAMIVPETPEISYEWTLASGGFDASFKDNELQSLLNRFSNLAITNAVDPDKKAEWGFDPPEYTVTLSVEGQDDITLYGGRDKPGGDAYIQLAGAEPALIYQISRFNFEQLFPQGSKLFTLPEWNVDEALITRIEVQRPDGEIILARDDETWRVVEPALGLETQKTALDNLVTAISALKPVDYADAGVDVGDFDTAIRIPVGEDFTRTLHLGQPSRFMDGRYARFDGAPEVLVLARSDVEKLTPPARDLYALSVLDFDFDAVAAIGVAHDDIALVVERDAEDDFEWRRTLNDVPGDVLHNDVEEFVFALNDFQVDNFLLDRDPASVQSTTTITVTHKDETVITLGIASEQDGMHEAVVTGLPYVFTVKPGELLRLMLELETLAYTPEEEPDTDTELAPDIVDDTADEAPAELEVLMPMEQTDGDGVVVERIEEGDATPLTEHDGGEEALEIVLDHAAIDAPDDETPVEIHIE